MQASYAAWQWCAHFVDRERRADAQLVHPDVSKNYLTPTLNLTLTPALNLISDADPGPPLNAHLNSFLPATYAP